MFSSMGEYTTLQVCKCAMNNERFVNNKSVTWVKVGVQDYVIVEHLQITDNQGDAALRMGNSEASQTLYQIRFLLLKSLSMVLKDIIT